jgi:hypothetical protein
MKVANERHAGVPAEKDARGRVRQGTASSASVTAVPSAVERINPKCRRHKRVIRSNMRSAIPSDGDGSSIARLGWFTLRLIVGGPSSTNV